VAKSNLFNKVILCAQEHTVIIVQVYANPFIGERSMNIEKKEVQRKINSSGDFVNNLA